MNATKAKLYNAYMVAETNEEASQIALAIRILEHADIVCGVLVTVAAVALPIAIAIVLP